MRLFCAHAQTHVHDVGWGITKEYLCIWHAGVYVHLRLASFWWSKQPKKCRLISNISPNSCINIQSIRYVLSAEKIRLSSPSCNSFVRTKEAFCTLTKLWRRLLDPEVIETAATMIVDLRRSRAVNGRDRRRSLEHLLRRLRRAGGDRVRLRRDGQGALTKTAGRGDRGGRSSDADHGRDRDQGGRTRGLPWRCSWRSPSNSVRCRKSKVRTSVCVRVCVL